MRERGRWFMALQVELPDVLPSADLVPTLGVDLGVSLFAALSDGRTVEPLDALRKQQRRLRHAQRSVWRKVIKGLSNRRKAVVAARGGGTRASRRSAATGCTSAPPSWLLSTRSSPLRA